MMSYHNLIFDMFGVFENITRNKEKGENKIVNLKIMQNCEVIDEEAITRLPQVDKVQLLLAPITYLDRINLLCNIDSIKSNTIKIIDGVIMRLLISINGKGIKNTINRRNNIQATNKLMIIKSLIKDIDTIQLLTEKHNTLYNNRTIATMTDEETKHSTPKGGLSNITNVSEETQAKLVFAVCVLCAVLLVIALCWYNVGHVALLVTWPYVLVTKFLTPMLVGTSTVKTVAASIFGTGSWLAVKLTYIPFYLKVIGTTLSAAWVTLVSYLVVTFSK